MYKVILPTIIKIDRKELKELTTEVKETIAKDYMAKYADKKPKRFGVIDLWKCRKNMRTAKSMRRW